MCGRYRLRHLDVHRLGADALPYLPSFEEFDEKRIIPPFEFIPSYRVPVVRFDGQKTIVDAASWGFVPEWARGGQKTKPINARSDRVASSGMFRGAFKSSRCLMPADGFYEPKGPKTLKHRPQYFFNRPDNCQFAFAGLLSKTDEGLTCALITTEPNHLVGAIHDRMPVILKPTDYAKWLDPQADHFELMSLLVAVPEDELIVEPVEPSKPSGDQPTLFD